jgi:hypothetical protein
MAALNSSGYAAYDLVLGRIGETGVLVGDS